MFRNIEIFFSQAICLLLFPCNKASLYTLSFCSGCFVGFSPVVVIFPMLFAENEKKRKSWHVQKFFSCMLDELWIYILPYYTHSAFGLKYLYTLCSGFIEFGKYFIEGIWRRGTLCWIEKCVTLAVVIVWILGMKVLVWDVAWPLGI